MAYAVEPIANGSIDCYTVFDTKQDHYHCPECRVGGVI